MELKFAGNYKEKEKKNFPSDRLSQEEKDDKKYFQQAATAIVSRYVNNECSIPYSRTPGLRTVRELRDYATGKNSTEKYKNWMLGKRATTGKRKTTLNISWDTVPVIPQLLDTVRGYMMKFNYDITTMAVDPAASAEKQQVKALMKLYMDENYRRLGRTINEALGYQAVDTQGPQMGDVPFRNDKEIDFFFQIGGFMLIEEVNIQKLIQKTLYEDGWDGIKDLIIDDLLTNSICATKVFSKPGSEKASVRYVDLEGLMFPFSNYNDYRDMTWCAEVRQMTIGDLRNETDLSDQELYEIAQYYQSSNHNYHANYPSNGNHWNRNKNGYINGEPFESITVQVADCCWVGTETQRMTTVYREKEGNLVLNKVASDYKMSDYSKKRGKRVHTYSKQTIYKTKMVIGSDHVFDYGKEYNITYKRNDRGDLMVDFPYKICRSGQSSLTERMIAFADDINMAFLKFRNAIKKALPAPGIAIKKSALEGISIDGVTFTPERLMQILSEEGYLIYDDQNQWGETKTSTKVIDFIPDNLATHLNALQGAVEYNFRMMQRVTGINDIFAGGTPANATGLGVAKIAINSTSNSIYPQVKAYEYIFEQTARVIAKQWQVISATFDKPRDIQVYSDFAIEFLSVTDSVALHEYGIKIEAGVNDEEKAMLMQQITQLRDYRRQTGTGGITPSQYILVYNMIRSGNTKQAMLVLAQIEDYQQEQDQARQMQMMQANQQSQMQAAQMAQQGKMQETQMEGQQEAQLAQQEAQLKLQHDMMLKQVDAQEKEKEHQRKMKEIAVQNIYGWSAGEYARMAQQQVSQQ